MLNFVLYCTLETFDIFSYIVLYEFVWSFFLLNLGKIGKIFNSITHLFRTPLDMFERFFKYHDSFARIISLYRRLWFDGLMVDSLQKMAFNQWAQKFILGTVMLFNDKFLFEKPARFLLDNLVRPLQNRFFFEGSDLFLTIFSVLFFISLIFVVLQAAFFISLLLLNGTVPLWGLGIINALYNICNT